MTRPANRRSAGLTPQAAGTTDTAVNHSRRSGRRHRVPRGASVLRRPGQMHIDWLDVDGVRIRYGLRSGHGRPMLLLNTMGANLDMLRPLVQALDDVELIALDVPGVGHSPVLGMPRGFKWHARLVVTLLDRLGYDEAIDVTGMAWGGSLAQQLALDFPQRVNRLVLAAASSGTISMPARRRSTLARLFTARRYRRNESIAERLPMLYGGLTRRRPELIDRRGPDAPGPSTRATIHQLLATLGWTSAHRLHGLRCPTLLMGGDDDPVMPLVNTRLLYWLIPKSYLHVVRGGGHLFLLVRAHESAAVIKRFINERRYDGTDGQDYFVARNQASDGRLLPWRAAPESED